MCPLLRASNEGLLRPRVARAKRTLDSPAFYTFTPIFSAFAITSSMGPTM